MSTILPTTRLKATRVNPKISIFYGPPKIGKTTLLSQLESCLVLDTERGADIIEVMRLPIAYIDGPTITDEAGVLTHISLNTVIGEIQRIGIDHFNKTGQKPKPPYKYLAVDTLDKLEDYAEAAATAGYRGSIIGKNFEGKSVLELPNGGGYYYLRLKLMEIIDTLANLCEHLILISHIKEKNINKGGVDVSVTDIALTGKLGKMMCAKVDIIGYLYREPGNPDLMVSFQTFEDSAMGARFPRLAGQKFKFDWNTIFIPEDSKSA